MMHVLKQLTLAAFTTLLMITVAGNLPSSLTSKIPQEFVSAAQLLALFAVLLLTMALLVPTVILREPTAMLMGHERWRDMNYMLRALSKLAFLAAVVAVDRILPYLTGDHGGDGEPRVVTTFISIAMDRILLYLSIAVDRILLYFSRLVTTIVAVSGGRVLPYLTGYDSRHGVSRIATIFVTLALGSWWLLSRLAQGGGGGSAGLRRAAVTPAPQAEPRPLGRVLWKLAHAASVAVLIAVAGILPLLTGRVTGDDVFFIALVFVLFVFLVLALGLLVQAVVCRNVPGTLDSEKPPARGGESGSAGLRRGAVMPVTIAVAPAPRAELRHMGGVRRKPARNASVAVLITVAGILPLLTGRVTGADVFFVAFVFVLFVFLVLALGLLVLAVVCHNVPGTLDSEKPPARGGESGSAGLRRGAVMPVTNAVAPAPRAEPRHMGGVLRKLAHATSVVVLIMVAGILPLLTGRVTGPDVFLIALAFVLIVFLVLALGLLVLAVVCRNVPGTLDSEKAALEAAMVLVVFAMSMVACYIIVGAILEV